jgi:small subunit ribosomal protein S9
MMITDFKYGTGRRKNATARTRLYEGTGIITVNGRPFENYFPRKSLQMVIRQPLILSRQQDRIDVKVRVDGGGISGQAEAVRHGISRALLEWDAELRGPLKKAGFLTRDARKKERKKYGLRAARARYQYSKR